MSEGNRSPPPEPGGPQSADGREPTAPLPPPGEDAERDAALDVAHVLFMDIVGYSKLLFDEQTEHLGRLQKIVRATEEFGRGQSGGDLICLPTGDGMALVFFGDPESPLRCAVEIAGALKDYPGLRLRMGIHSGPVYRIADINANRNVAGGGINVAQRVMDCGDAGHILLSKRMADDLGQLTRWAGHLHDLGEVPVKHGVMVHVFNYYADGLGNAETPAKVTAAAGARKRKKGPSVSAAAVVLLLVIAGGLLGLVAWSMLRRPPAAEGGGRAGPAGTPARTLDYWITVQKYRDGKPFEKPFRLSGEINFEKDYRIRLNFVSALPGYLYLINEGPAGAEGPAGYNILFPTPTANGGSSALTPNRPVQIPGQSWLVFDGEKGTESIWVVWSARSIAELEGLKALANPEHKGAVEDPTQISAVRELLAKYSGPEPTAVKKPAEELTTVSGAGDVLLYPIRLAHH